MGAALAPVQTRAADRTSAPHIGREDAEVLHLCPTGFGQCRSIARNFDDTTGAQGIGDADTQHACQKIVTGPRRAQARVLWAGTARWTDQSDATRFA
jgi:hypothetical protein